MQRFKPTSVRKNNSPYSNKFLLTELSVMLCDKMEELTDKLNISLKFKNNRYEGPCPIHGGNKHNGFALYPDGDLLPGAWHCRTRNCDHIFPYYSAVGFVRGVLSHQLYGWEDEGGKMVGHREAVDYCLKFLGKRIEDITYDKEKYENRKFISSVNYLTAEASDGSHAICSRDKFRKAMKVPSAYYIDLGYSRNVIDQYDIGVCGFATHRMYQRIVVPIYDVNYNMLVGYVGRSPFDECEKCGRYHAPTSRCNSVTDQLGAKWLNSEGFSNSNHLFNYWHAKKHINQSKSIVIVEGVGDVLRLEESGIHHSVALFGNKVTGLQQQKFEACGASLFIVATDNDDGGDKAYESVIKKCDHLGRIIRCKLPNHRKDIGEMPVEEVRKHLLNFIMSKGKNK